MGTGPRCFYRSRHKQGRKLTATSFSLRIATAPGGRAPRDITACADKTCMAELIKRRLELCEPLDDVNARVRVDNVAHLVDLEGEAE